MRKKRWTQIISFMLVFVVLFSLISFTSLATASNDYTQWRQADPEWNRQQAWPSSQYPNATYHYMSEAGCLITSIAMLLRQYNVVTDSNVNNFNPWICNQQLASAGALDSAADIIYGNISNAYPGFSYVNNTGYSSSTLINLFNQGYACIVAVNNYGHYVAVRSADSSGIVIMDPGWGNTSLSAFSAVNAIYYFKITAVPHTSHDKGTYMYYEAMHPHRNCYKCSVCGTIWADDSSSNIVSSCEKCAKPGKPALTGFKRSYSSGEETIFEWNNTENTTHYNLYIDKLGSDGNWEIDNKVWHYAESGLSAFLSDGIYRVLLQSTNSNGSGWPYTNADYITFTVGAHTHDKGEYTFYEKLHPHCNCYECSYCGEIWRDSNSSNELENCYYCQRPEKPVLNSLRTEYATSESITFTWDSTAKTTHYNLYIDKLLPDGTWNIDYLVWHYAESGFSTNLEEGSYRVLLQSTNSNCSGEDGTGWAYTNGDYITFVVSVPHIHSFETIITPPTCVEQGFTTYRCACGYSYIDDYKSAIGHNTELQNVKAATCTAEGYTGDNVCTVCGETINMGNVIQPTGHEWDSGVVTKKPTESAEGVKTYTCKICGDTKTQSISKLPSTLSITSQPDNYTGKLNSTATFSVSAMGDGLTYHWQYNNPASGVWKNSSSKTVGYNTDTLTVEATAARNGYQYRCVVTDANGNTVTSEPATLTVFAIKTHPKDAAVVGTGSANFKVSATGADLTYQWQYKNPATGVWKNCSSATKGYNTATLTVQGVSGSTNRNGYQYRCVVMDSAGNKLTSKAVTLTVFAIKTQPKDASTSGSAKASFKVAATGTDLTYQWQYKNPANGVWKNCTAATEGYNTATLKVAGVTGKTNRNGYQYRCIVTSGDNALVTNAVTLTVK